MRERLRGEERGGQRDGAGGGNRAVFGFGEISTGLDADELRRLDQAVEERGAADAALGARSVVIFATDRWTLRIARSALDEGRRRHDIHLARGADALD